MTTDPYAQPGQNAASWSSRVSEPGESPTNSRDSGQAASANAGSSVATGTEKPYPIAAREERTPLNWHTRVRTGQLPGIRRP